MATHFGTQVRPIGLELQNRRALRVPLYQRDYSWTDRHIEQLFDDVREILTDTAKDHFMGSVVFNASREDDIEIIDGQQRITSVSILIAVLRDLADEHGDQTRADMLSAFLGKRDPLTLKIEPRLRLNAKNNDIYQKHIANKTPLSEKQAAFAMDRDASNRLLLQAYLNLRIKVEEHTQNDGAALTDLLVKFIPAVEDRIKLIVITVEDQANAFLIFETLNDRGLALSVADLMKNFFFMRIPKERHEACLRRWTEMVSLLGDVDPTTYIRHYWLSHNGIVRERELYKKISDNIQQPHQAEDLLENLRKAAEVYGALASAESELWDGLDPGSRDRVRSALEELAVFRSSQCFPMLLAVFDMFDGDRDIAEAFRYTASFIFWYTIVCQEGATYLEGHFSEVARKLRKKEITTVDEVKGALSSLLPPQDRRQIDFQSKSEFTARVGRHILQRINNYLMSPEGQVVTSTSTAALNLEHILPKRPTAEWLVAFPNQDDAERYINRLGNLTLVDPDANRRGSNKSFAEKSKKIFEADVLKINDSIRQTLRWGPAEIDARQGKLLQLALKVWRV